MGRIIKVDDYFPSVVKDTDEFKAIAVAENTELALLNAEIINAFRELFIVTAEDYGLSLWENMLNITPNDSYSADERRAEIIARLNNRTLYTFRNVYALLVSLCGEDNVIMEYDSQAYTLNVKIGLVAKKMLQTVKSLLFNITPANISLNIDLIYNTHAALRGFTHGELSVYTHDELKNEVIGE